MKKLIKLLQQAYAIETGAIEAYEGHWRSLDTPEERGEIQSIQCEEREHREAVGYMLEELGAEPSPTYNAILAFIGKSISFGCKFMGYRLAMWGAGIMEKLGGVCYKQISAEARACRKFAMASELHDMQLAEERHERFFKDKLGDKV